MKSYILITALLISILSLSRAACEAEEDSTLTLAYYENMSAIAFLYGLEIYKLEDDPDVKLNHAREISYIMFRYWADTRKGELIKSSTLDHLIPSIYQKITKQSDLIPVDDVFSDPLSWFPDNHSEKLTEPESLKGISFLDYQSIVKEYKSFLEKGEDNDL